MRRSLAARILALAVGMSALAPTLAVAADPSSPAAEVPKPDLATEVTAQARVEARSALSTAARSLAGESAVSPSIALSELNVSYDALTTVEQRRADDLLARPTDGSGIDPEVAKYPPGATLAKKCRDDVCVHYVTTGTHRPAGSTSTSNQMNAWVERSLAEVIAVWSHHTKLGYRPPPADKGAGGTPEFDVYLADTGDEGIYGYCAPEDKLSNRRDDFRRTGFCVLDNDFAEFRLGPEQSLKATAAHEFFHAIQFGYDASEDSWFKEATATWIEERYATEINDNRQYLRHGQLGRPTLPMDRFGGLAHYGQWIFIEKLSRTYGVAVVRLIWERLDSGPGARDEFSVQAISRVLRNRRTTLPAFFAAFGAGNLAPAATYAEGAAYTAAPLAARMALLPARRQRTWSSSLAHLTTQSIQVRPAPALKGPWKLRIRVDGPRRATGPGAHVQIFKRNGTIVRKPVNLDRQGRGGLRVGFAPGSVWRVTVTVANASTRYANCWRSTPFACSGTPRDNGKGFRVTARAVR
ncbi:MXAN_6640 family putative metalloprotease [Nocardioides pacificus]